MDAHHQWHVRMAAPTVLPTVDIYVTPETGTLFTHPFGQWLGDLLFDFVDSQARTILQLLDLPPDVLPIFVTQNVSAEAGGFHAAYEVPGGGGASHLQTYLYVGWVDLGLFLPAYGDFFNPLSHELAEWANDPYINNVVPTWSYPPITDPASSCAFPLLEVGDPQSGDTINNYPVVPISVPGGLHYVQQLVLWQWFADEVPSSAYGGWYTFPMPNSITTPATYCQ